MIFNPFPLLTGMLGLFGGWSRKQPQVSLIAEPFLGGQRYLYFVIRNPREEQIRVTAITVKPALFDVWRDDSPEAAAEAICGIAASAFIEPGAEKRFPVSVAGGLSDENRELLCSVTVSWRSMRHEQLRRAPAIYRTTVTTLEAQLADKA